MHKIFGETKFVCIFVSNTVDKPFILFEISSFKLWRMNLKPFGWIILGKENMWTAQAIRGFAYGFPGPFMPADESPQFPQLSDYENKQKGWFDGKKKRHFFHTLVDLRSMRWQEYQKLFMMTSRMVNSILTGWKVLKQLGTWSLIRSQTKSISNYFCLLGPSN